MIYLSEKVRYIEQQNSLCLCGVISSVKMSMDSVPKDLRGLRAEQLQCKARRRYIFNFFTL